MRERRGRVAAAVTAALVGTLLMAGGQTAQAAATCSHSVGYEVDGQRGTVVLLPRVRCTTAIRVIRILSFTPAQQRSILYENRAAGTYSGYGLSLPRNSSREYCMVVSSEWVTSGGIQGSELTRHCVRV